MLMVRYASEHVAASVIFKNGKTFFYIVKTVKNIFRKFRLLKDVV